MSIDGALLDAPEADLDGRVVAFLSAHPELAYDLMEIAGAVFDLRSGLALLGPWLLGVPTADPGGVAVDLRRVLGDMAEAGRVRIGVYRGREYFQYTLP